MERDLVQHQPMQKEIERNLIRLTNTAEINDTLHSDAGKDSMLSAINVIKWGMKLLFTKIGINYTVKLQRLLIWKSSTYLLLHVSLLLNQVKIDLLKVVVLMTNNNDLFKELSNISTLKI